MPQSDSKKMEQSANELQEILQEFRDSVRFEADRPDFFWIRQRNAIMVRLKKPASLKQRRALLAAPAAGAAVLLCLFFFAENSKAPSPDLAAGYDQDLLVEIERALSRRHPDALSPALLIIQDMEQIATKHP